MPVDKNPFNAKSFIMASRKILIHYLKKHTQCFETVKFFFGIYLHFCISFHLIVSFPKILNIFKYFVYASKMSPVPNYLPCYLLSHFYSGSS